MPNTNLLNAIRVVKENEKIAMDSYAKAAAEITNPFGKKLFEQLSEFERFHYNKLTALEKSLQESGLYIEYEGKEFPLPPAFEILAAQEPQKKSVMHIISDALKLEKQAQNAYASLAAKVPDQQGHDMFIKLADEEHTHFLILSDAYWSLNNTGNWKWSNP